MTKKQLTIIIIAVILIILITARLIINSRKKVNYETVPKLEVTQSQSKFDEDTGLYYLKDENTGEIIAASRDENDLQFYIDHPDYNPDPLTPRSKNLEDFLAPGENLQMVEE